MGFERNAAAWWLKLRDEGVRFGRVLTLGHQAMHLDPATLARVYRRLGVPQPAETPPFADTLLLAMGAASVEAVDASPYEQATRIHDLNEPVPRSWHEQFDVVFDGGTLEHVFNVPGALANCIEMLKVGGRFVAATVANNWCGHGFYQFSPELFYRAFSPANGCAVVEMVVADADGRRCYRVVDPDRARARIQLWTCDPLYLLVHARRDAVVPVFATAPQQADYVRDWTTTATPAAMRPNARWKTLPGVGPVLAWRSRRLWQRRRRASLDDRRFFTPVDLAI